VEELRKLRELSASLGWEIYKRYLKTCIDERLKGLGKELVTPDTLAEHNHRVGVCEGLALAISLLEIKLSSEEYSRKE